MMEQHLTFQGSAQLFQMEKRQMQQVSSLFNYLVLLGVGIVQLFLSPMSLTPQSFLR